MLPTGRDGKGDGAVLWAAVFGPLQHPLARLLLHRRLIADDVSAATLRQERRGIEAHAIDEEERSATKRTTATTRRSCPEHVRFPDPDYRLAGALSTATRQMTATGGMMHEPGRYCHDPPAPGDEFHRPLEAPLIACLRRTRS